MRRCLAGHTAQKQSQGVTLGLYAKVQALETKHESSTVVHTQRVCTPLGGSVEWYQSDVGTGVSLNPLMTSV